MKKIFILLYLFIPNLIFSQVNVTPTTSKNYVHEINYKQPYQASQINNVPNVDKLENIIYSDGFGKTTQVVAAQQNVTGKDIIQHVYTDEFGRKSKQYLPFKSTLNTGEYVDNAEQETLNYYTTLYSDFRPFSETIFNDSPLNQVKENIQIGDDFINHSSKIDYTTNNQTGRRVLNFEVTLTNGVPSLASNPQPFADNQISIIIYKNENWISSDGKKGTKETYKNKSGNLVLNREFNDNETALDTYYVYDVFGNLTYILPPNFDINSITNPSITNHSKVTFNWSNFMNSPIGGGGGGGNIEVLNNILKVSFDAGFTTQPLKTAGVVMALGWNDIPDLTIGSFASGNYTAFLKNGDLYIEGNGTSVGGLSFTADIDLNQSGGGNPDNDATIYQFRYDERNRLVEKKIPGREKEYFVYDNNDRPVLTQDPNLRLQNLWMFSKFDNFGRVIYSGIYSTSLNQSELQTQIDNFSAGNNKSNSENRISATNTIAGIALNYDNSAFPNTGIDQILTVNYYDDYNFTDTDKPATPTNVLNQQITTRTKGLLTSSWVKTLDDNTWTKSYSYYDEKASPIKIYTKNYLGGFTNIESLLDFRGNLDQTVTTHKRLSTDTSVTITDDYFYDEAERFTKQTQKINSQDTETIVDNTYDDLGQLIIKEVGGKTNALQIVNYNYNIQGLLTQINNVETSLNGTGENDLFAFKINYLTNEGTASSTPNYNGNISQTIWKNRHTNEKEAYTYSYDKLNRLNDADYRKGSSLNTGAGNFELHNITFDNNGNIKTLQRKSETGVTIDNLTYDYTYSTIDKGNQLQLIIDTSSNATGFTDGNTSGLDYEYDGNGNLTKDNNKGITNIEYNIIDLPKKVTFSNGATIEMIYNAAGQKLKKIYNVSGNTTNTYYIDGFQYLENQLQFFAQSEGYAYKDGSNYKYSYLFSDYLGNNRLSYTDTNGDDFISSTEILTATNYYPMGMIQSGEFVSGIGSNYNYKFQSKELQQESGLQMYDFGSRLYDATTGRWFAIDPQSQFGSPYLAMGNNFILLSDPNGEYALIDDLIAGAIGGAFNLGSQLLSGNVQGFGDGLGYFATGFAGGVATIYGGPIVGGMIMGAGNSAISQYTSNGNVDFASTFQGAVMGGLTSGVGAGLGTLATPVFSKVFSNISNTFLQQALIQTTTQGSTGFLLGTGFSLYSGADLSTAITEGGIPGLGFGIVSGVITAQRYNNKNFLDRQQRKQLQKQTRDNKIKAREDSGFLKSLKNTISVQKQARHIEGTAGRGKSYLNSLRDAQSILDAVHSGKATYLGTSKAGHQIYKYSEITGTNVNLGVGIKGQPTNIFMIKGTASPSIVPTNPIWTP